MADRKTLDQFTIATAKPGIHSLLFARDANLSAPLSRSFALRLLMETIRDGFKVKSMAVSNPVALTPSDGDAYVVLATGAGAWAGKDNNIAVYNSETAAWTFSAPAEGWSVYDQNTNAPYRYTGSAWAFDSASAVAFDNTTSGLTATTVQAAIDEMGTAFGILRTQSSDSATLGSIGTTAQTLPFAAAPFGVGVTASAANNSITVLRDGDYVINFVLNFSSVASGDAGLYACIVQEDGADTAIECDRQMSGTSDTGSMSATGILNLTANQVITVDISSDNGADSDDINIINASLYVQMLRAT